jgi:hypothetical protein
MAKPQIYQPVDIEDTEQQIFSETTSDAIVEEFYRFGQILFSECLQRGSELDRKLANMLGWSTAALAFLLLNHSKASQFGIFGGVKHWYCRYCGATLGSGNVICS